MSTSPAPSPDDLAVLARLQGARQPLGLPDPSIPSPEELIREGQFARRATLPPPPRAWRWQGAAWAASLALRLVLLLGAGIVLLRAGSSPAPEFAPSFTPAANVPTEISPFPQLRLAAAGLAAAALAGVVAGALALGWTRRPLLDSGAAEQLRRSCSPARLLRLNLLTLAVLCGTALAASGAEEVVGYGFPSEVRELIVRYGAGLLLIGTGFELLALTLAWGVRVLRAAAPRRELALPRGQRLLARSGALLTAGMCLSLTAVLAGALGSSVWDGRGVPPPPTVSAPFARAAASLAETPHTWELRTGSFSRAELDDPLQGAAARVAASQGSAPPSSPVPAPGVSPSPAPVPRYGSSALLAPARLRLVQRFSIEEGGGRLQEFTASRNEFPGALTPRIIDPTYTPPGFFATPVIAPLEFLGAAVGPLERTASLADAERVSGAVPVAPEGCEVYEGELRQGRLQTLEIRRLAGFELYSPQAILEPRWAREVASEALADEPEASVRICLDPSDFPVLVEIRQLQGSRVAVSQLRPVMDATLPLLPRGAFPPLPPELGPLGEPSSRLGETLGRIFTD